MRLHDIQALLRRLQVKRRDGAVDRLILLVPGTRPNRDMLRITDPGLAAAFPTRSRAVLGALADGRDPGADGLVVL
jgi:hypothetical protein